ncbi:MAG: hypothetical protein FWF57_06445 [Defluviitaleaceae bacterium]|nr:hypothetical protein [Defluviitaleaceae bacterium]
MDVFSKIFEIEENAKIILKKIEDDKNKKTAIVEEQIKEKKIELDREYRIKFEDLKKKIGTETVREMEEFTNIHLKKPSIESNKNLDTKVLKIYSDVLKKCLQI